VAEAGGRLREAMPQCAAIVDELRQVFGREAIDRLLRAAGRGAPVLYLAELGADGELRQWGRAPSGRVAVCGGDGGVRMVRRAGPGAGGVADQRGMHGAHGEHRG
jgi:hypothetical protein